MLFSTHRRIPFSCIAFFTVLFVLIQLKAQELEIPEPRQGYYLSVGGSAAVTTLYLSEDRNWMGPFAGPFGSLRAGQSVTSWLDMGIGINVGKVYGGEYKALMGSFTLEAQFRLRKRLFLRASTGFGFADVSRRKKNLKKIDGLAGGSYGMGLGYDFFPLQRSESGGIAISPVVVIKADYSEMISNFSGYVAVAFTWWAGLEKNKLK